MMRIAQVDGVSDNATWAFMGVKGQIVPSPYEALHVHVKVANGEAPRSPDDSTVSACITSGVTRVHMARRTASVAVLTLFAACTAVERMRQQAAVNLCAEQDGRNAFCAGMQRRAAHCGMYPAARQAQNAWTSLSPGLGLPAATMQDITAATYAKMAASVTALPAALPPDPAQPADVANHLPIIIVGMLQWHGG
jgi:hypothetical protein